MDEEIRTLEGKLSKAREGGQAGDDVRAADGEGEVDGKWVVDSGKYGMAGDVTALEGTLSKARQVKAGMMSELLTGRTRLV